MQTLMSQAIADGRAVPPEQAIAAARQFVGDPNLPVTITAFNDDLALSDTEWCYYTLRTPYNDRFSVKGLDGKVYDWSGTSVVSPLHLDPTATPTVTVEQARATAIQYAHQRVPGFDETTWVGSFNETSRGTIDFAWFPVVGPVPALAPFILQVSVDRFNGQVTHIAIPPNRITGPVVPAVSEQQARQIAARVAPFDPALVPFSNVELEMVEDLYGVQGLLWNLDQKPGPRPENAVEEGYPGEANILIEGMTGIADVAFPLAFSGKRPIRGQAALRAQKKGPRPVTLRPAGGKPADCYAYEVKGGRLWVRAEMLRAAGARLLVEPGRIKARRGAAVADAAGLGAERRGGNWWAPLRKAASALGLAAAWDGKRRAVDLSDAVSASG
jgi:hypothetical protein